MIRNCIRTQTKWTPNDISTEVTTSETQILGNLPSVTEDGASFWYALPLVLLTLPTLEYAPE